MQNLTIKNELVFFANVVSGSLGHTHAVSNEVAATIPSLRALQLRWQAEGAIRNDDLSEQGLGWMTGMEGWHEEYRTEHKYDLDYQVIEALSHTTASGRMDVRVTELEARFRFFAGPTQGTDEGRMVLEVHYRPNYEESQKVYINFLHSALLKGRSDRTALLWQIDEAYEGKIFQALEKSTEQNAAQLLEIRKVMYEEWEKAKLAEEMKKLSSGMILADGLMPTFDE